MRNARSSSASGALLEHCELLLRSRQPADASPATINDRPHFLLRFGVFEEQTIRHKCGWAHKQTPCGQPLSKSCVVSTGACSFILDNALTHFLLLLDFFRRPRALHAKRGVFFKCLFHYARRSRTTVFGEWRTSWTSTSSPRRKHPISTSEPTAVGDASSKANTADAARMPPKPSAQTISPGTAFLSTGMASPCSGMTDGPRAYHRHRSGPGHRQHQAGSAKRLLSNCVAVVESKEFNCFGLCRHESSSA